MAKQSTSDIVKLLSATEQRLFHSSRGTKLATATAAELGKSIELARALRDKWRDQFRSQRRAGQAAARGRGVDGNERSEQKSRLFGEVLERLQGRLAEIGSSVSKAVGSKRQASARPSRAARTAGHRATRAGIRASLAGLSTAIPGTRAARPAAKPTANPASKPASKPAALAVATSAAAPATGASAKTKKRGKARRAGVVPAAVDRATKKTKKTKKTAGFSPLAQLAAGTKLKKHRLRLGGFDTRLRGHVSASGKRSQGRRDSRGR